LKAKYRHQEKPYREGIRPRSKLKETKRSSLCIRISRRPFSPGKTVTQSIWAWRKGRSHGLTQRPIKLCTIRLRTGVRFQVSRRTRTMQAFLPDPSSKYLRFHPRSHAEFHK